MCQKYTSRTLSAINDVLQPNLISFTTENSVDIFPLYVV